MDYKALSFKAEDVDEKQGIIKGYAATWDLDSGNDIIIRGAFTKTLAEKGNQVKILWNHKSDLPIGKPTVMREDDKGLYIEGKISNTTQGSDIRTLMLDGVIDQMSIGYIANDTEYKDDGVRVIKELELFEFSPVTWPMNEAAVIESVKSLCPKEIERVLREAGLSRSQAKCVTNNGFKGLREAREQEPNNELLADLKRAVDMLTINANLKV